MANGSLPSKQRVRSDLILVTGQSGIEVKQCLKKLVASERTLSLEGAMMDLTRRSKGVDPTAGSDAEVMTEILGYPPLIQKRTWDEAFDLVETELRNAPRDRGGPRFVTFHASYYHQRKREFISPINFSKLKKLQRRCKLVIVLIDDCYDIYRRLLGEDKMFYEDVMRDDVSAQEAAIKSILNLLMILSWRDVEIAFSRKIAETLGVPFFVVAVKHPILTLRKLAFEPIDRLRAFYLAHPISTVRGRAQVRSSQFPGELNSFVRYASSNLNNAVFFIPDTIDELRIKRTADGTYLPELSEGWPLPCDDAECLFIPLPDQQRSVNPLNPKRFDYSENPRAGDSIAYAIGILAEKIREQITSRDFSLLEQSKDGMVAFQPYLDGGKSAGALEEAKYNFELQKQPGQKRRALYVMEKEENLGKRRIEHLFSSLQGQALRQEDCSADTKSKLDGLSEQWKQDKSIIEQFCSGTFQEETIRQKIDRVLPVHYDFNEKFLPPERSPLSSASMYGKQERLKTGWDILLDTAKTHDPFRRYCLNPRETYVLSCADKFELSIKRFAQYVGGRVERGRKKR